MIGGMDGGRAAGCGTAEQQVVCGWGRGMALRLAIHAHLLVSKGEKTRNAQEQHGGPQRVGRVDRRKGRLGGWVPSSTTRPTSSRWTQLRWSQRKQ
jgi:hypothetical protein